MIPRAYINAWRATAPWLDSGQVEQDLVISRALVELYNHPEIASGLAFRGGTALHKIYLHPAGRYSEDIDLVQITAGPIGQLVAKVRQVLDPWLGPPMTARAADRFSLNYRFASSFEPVVRARLKVEINTREHFSLYGLTERPFTVSSPWFTGSASITTYCLSELLGTKLRALFQRKKGRDLFDLWVGLRAPEVSVEEILASFAAYMALGGVSITRARFEANLEAKMKDAAFLGDLRSLLRPGLEYDTSDAWREVHERIVSRIPGHAWRGAGA